MTAFRDLLSGLVLLLLSAAFIIVGSGYGLGSPLRLGPGFLPIVTASILGIIGIAITVNALRAGVTLPDTQLSRTIAFLRAPIAILGSIIVFSLTINRFGLLVASALVVAISSLAEPGTNIIRVVILSIVLSGGAAVIFVFGLGLPIRLFRWWG